ncbi:MAG: hypothetical protein K6A14_00840 [Erysipelotrichaceae bacterium]|nr:hypothetical protein [Erysipelotrichaceae bacterium]
MSQYRKNLLEQLRLAVYEKPCHELTDERLQKAVTVNAELQNLGYSLTAQGIAQLAGSDSLESFYADFRQLIPNITVKPMYPDFPTQVINMEEAQFRFHQYTHYLSTYGIEELAAFFGQNYQVKKGWLPEVEDTEKTESDEALLKAKTIELILPEDAYRLPVEKLLNKGERLTAQELEIIREALGHLDVASLEYDIPFKQNMMPVFYELFRLKDNEVFQKAASALCQHTGDVLKCLDYVLTHCKYHFTSAQKNRLVSLIESYPVEDWKANVILSNKKARRTVKVLEYLSYNRFSRSEGHKEVVRALRNGELTSWEGQVKAMLAKGDEGVLDFVAQRPGMLLRWTNWLISLGLDRQEIKAKLLERAEDLSTRTLIFATTQLGRSVESFKTFEVLRDVLAAKLKLLETPLAGKKVFVDEGRLDLAHSMLLAKGDEAGYVRNGLAYKIPEEVDYIRFFVYWNDEGRVDIDLHASGSTRDHQELEIGWNTDYKNDFCVHSGDITHSDAAEYIDMKMSSKINEIQFNINLYTGKPTFDQIDKCFVGLMAVKKIGTNVKLYDPKNCFFYNDIRSKTRTLNYGYVNAAKRYLCLDGTVSERQWMEGAYSVKDHTTSLLNLESYLEMLLKAQGAQAVKEREESDLVLVMEKPENENEISLIDHDFFIDK